MQSNQCLCFFIVMEGNISSLVDWNIFEEKGLVVLLKAYMFISMSGA